MNNITYAVSVDVNNPIIPYNVYVASVLDSNVRYLEITLYQNGNVIALSNTATATASLVTDNVLVNGSVNCTIQDNIITVPLEDLQRHGNLDVQVTVTEGTKVLAIPFPIQVRVTPNIAETAQIDENSLGSYAEVVHEITEARGTYTTLHDAIAAKLSATPGAVDTENLADKSITVEKVADDLAAVINAKAPLSTAYTFDITTTNVVYNANNPKTIYLNATVDGEAGIVITAKDNGFQYFLGRRGTLKIRYSTGGTSYSNWTQVIEYVDNKRNAITDANKMSEKYYPSIKAVVDYLTANYLGSGDNTVLWDNLAVAVQNLINGKENTSNKLTSQTGIDSDSTDTEYPTAKAVYEFGADILDDVAGDLVRKESISNKKHAIAGNETSEEYYPSTKAVYDYGSQISSAVEDVKAYLGYTSGDILGLQADFENKVFTRLGAAVGKNAGSDFDVFPMYGGRRRVVVDSDGVIDDSIVVETVTPGDYDIDVMVYQPKFYYKVVPLKLEKQSGGTGYHIRKANYYITSTPHAGFKVHPLFIDANGNEVDYVLLSAYEASYLHAETGNYHYFSDGTDTNTNIDWAHDVLKSMPGVKPISGQRKAMTKANMEALAQRKSSNWHLDTIKSVSANQLLMIIEMGQFNTQAAMGSGVTETPNNGAYNCSSLTGSTASLGNATGMAAETTYESAGNETVNTTNGKLSVSYRGLENPWGNIWKHVNGINLWGNGEMGGGQAYIADNFSFDEEAHSGNYHPAGFTIANASGWISAFAYGNEDFDWLFMPSETTGNSSLPVGDRYYGTEDMNGYYIIRHGGYWNSGNAAGGFLLNCLGPSGSKANSIGGRLLYVPTAAV